MDSEGWGNSERCEVSDVAEESLSSVRKSDRKVKEVAKRNR